MKKNKLMQTANGAHRGAYPAKFYFQEEKRMKHTWKRLTALLLALAMCLSMLPASALAAEDDGSAALASEESAAGG